MRKTLILGGTQFIGRSLVERLQAEGDIDLTLFNRQKTQANLFPALKKIKGDRETNEIEQIADQEWDYVVDLSCYYPDALSNVLKQVNGRVKKYIFISTCSVYDNADHKGQLRNESARTLSCSDEQRIDRTTATYGNRKAECERILMASGFCHTIFRPALVYGKYDHTDRFYYWLYQVKTKETLLLPDMGERLFSITYVEDLAASIIHAMQDNTLEGVYNAITVPQASIRHIVDCAKSQLNRSNRELNASAFFLRQNEIDPWIDMPLWIDGDHFTYSNQKLIEGSECSPCEFETSVCQTIDYYADREWKEPVYGISEKTRRRLIKRIELETNANIR